MAFLAVLATTSPSAAPSVALPTSQQSQQTPTSPLSAASPKSPAQVLEEAAEEASKHSASAEEEAAEAEAELRVALAVAQGPDAFMSEALYDEAGLPIVDVSNTQAAVECAPLAGGSAPSAQGLLARRGADAASSDRSRSCPRLHSRGRVGRRALGEDVVAHAQARYRSAEPPERRPLRLLGLTAATTEQASAGRHVRIDQLGCTPKLVDTPVARERRVLFAEEGRSDAALPEEPTLVAAASRASAMVIGSSEVEASDSDAKGPVLQTAPVDAAQSMEQERDAAPTEGTDASALPAQEVVAEDVGASGQVERSPASSSRGRAIAAPKTEAEERFMEDFSAALLDRNFRHAMIAMRSGADEEPPAEAYTSRLEEAFEALSGSPASVARHSPDASSVTVGASPSASLGSAAAASSLPASKCAADLAAEDLAGSWVAEASPAAASMQGRCRSPPPAQSSTSGEEPQNSPSGSPLGSPRNRSPFKKAVFGLARRKLTNVTEQRVLKTGLRQLHALFIEGRQGEVAEIHVEQDIARKMLGRTFLERLLKGEFELKGCMENDVASAQSDLRHLTAEQLLLIRVPTLDFQTAAGSHSARQSFLEMADRQLFSKLPPLLFRGGVALPEQLELVHALGVRLAIVLGAVQLMRTGWGSGKSSQVDADASMPALPSKWAFKLSGEHWAGRSCVALVDVDEPGLRVLPGEDKPDFSEAGAVGKVAVVCDRTQGVGGSRMLHWEICVLDPMKHDVMNEFEEEVAEKAQQQLTNELHAALARHKASPEKKKSHNLW